MPSSTRYWRSAAQAALAILAVLFVTPSLAGAQLGRALGSPVPAPPGPADGAGGADGAHGADGAGEWTFDLTASASVPLSLGVDGTLTHRSGVFTYASVGHTPNAYLSAIADVLGDADVYAARARPLVDEMIANGAWNLRLGLGYALPEGLELSAGYTLVSSASALSPSAIERATQQPFRWPGMREVPLSITLHALHARVGWRFVVEEHFVTRVSLGWTHTVAAQTGVEVPDDVRALPSDPAGDFETELARGMREYGFTPELILSMGYRF